jgi:hypothetical protein
MKKSRAAKDSQRGDCHEQKPTCTDPWKPVPTYYKALQRLPDFWAFILLEIPIKIKLRELIVAIRELNGSSIPMIMTFTQLGAYSSGDYNKQEMAPWPGNCKDGHAKHIQQGVTMGVFGRSPLH